MSEHVFADDGDGLYCTCGRVKNHPLHAAPALPDTPYAGTSGWSGSDTSRERAEDADADGTTSERQAKVLAALGGAHGHLGLTWREVAEAFGWHHGQASGALSVLHKQGRIARLTERRDKCAVYVLPEHVNGRETAAHGRDRLTGDERAALAQAEEILGYGGDPTRDDVEIIVAALRRLAG